MWRKFVNALNNVLGVLFDIQQCALFKDFSHNLLQHESSEHLL